MGYMGPDEPDQPYWHASLDGVLAQETEFKKPHSLVYTRRRRFLKQIGLIVFGRCMISAMAGNIILKTQLFGHQINHQLTVGRR